MGSHYTFGWPGAAWAARAERFGFLVYWDESQQPTGAYSFSHADTATLADLPGVNVQRMTLVANPPLAPTPTVVRSMVSVQLKYWLLVVVFGLLPAGRLAWLRVRGRRRRRVVSEGKKL